MLGVGCGGVHDNNQPNKGQIVLENEEQEI